MSQLRSRCLAAAVMVSSAVPVCSQSLVTGPALPLPKPVGDVDGDGRADWTSASGTAIVHGSATNAPIAHFTRTAAANEYYGPAGDLDADGFDDVVWLDAAGVATALSGVDGSTLWSWPVASSGAPYGLGSLPIAVIGGGDFDADGFDDVILQAGTTIDVRSGRTGQVIHSMTVMLYPNVPGFVIGDTDGDGYVDFTATEPAFSRFRIVRGPTFATSTLDSRQRCWVGDVDCNGAIDHVRGTATLGTVEMVDGATGQVLGTMPLVLNINSWVIATPAHDVDGDGNDDFHVRQTVYPFFPPFVGVASGATFAKFAKFAGSPSTPSVSLGDLDGDGRTEMVTDTGALLEWIDPAVPIASRLVRRGASGTTSAGTKLRLATRGSCALTKQVFFDTRGMLPISLGLLVLGAPLNVDLTPLGAPGNRAYASHGALLLLISDAGGVTVQSFTMPNDPTLLGSSISAQSVLLDPAANAFGFVTSNAIDVHTDN